MFTLNFQKELKHIRWWCIFRQMGLVGPLVGGIVGGLGVTSASVASALWQRHCYVHSVHSPKAKAAKIFHFVCVLSNLPKTTLWSSKDITYSPWLEKITGLESPRGSAGQLQSLRKSYTTEEISFWYRNPAFLAVQNSSIGDLVTDWVTEWPFDFDITEWP